tara:strand:- start:390 stop:662 length:273 start_codon:yes stop_codon:yes gene_type:complete
MRATELNRNTPFFPKKQPLDGWSKLGIDLFRSSFKSLRDALYIGDEATEDKELDFLLNPNPWHLYLDMDMDFIHRAIERLRADVEEQRVN